MRIVIVAGDAGGAACLAPVIATLQTSNDASVACFGAAAAAETWSLRGITSRPVETIDVDGCDRVVTGTSVSEERWELRAIREAGKLGIATLTVLDAGVHYRERFVDATGVLQLPDVIAVPDERARNEMRAQGFPPERLVVTGQPAFDELDAYDDAALRDAARRETRALAGCADDDQLCLLYASQPLSQLATRDTLGFDERDVIAPLIADLERLLARRGCRATLLVRPHPRERGRPPTVPASRVSDLRVAVVDDPQLDPRRLVVGSDLVIGMNSMLLEEAAFLQVPVVSVQPGLRTPDTLMANRSGLSRAVYRREALPAALEAELFDEVTRRERQRRLRAAARPRGATSRVLALLADMRTH